MYRLKILLKLLVDLRVNNLVVFLTKLMMILTILCSTWQLLTQSLQTVRLKDNHKHPWQCKDKQYILMKKVMPRMLGSEKKKLWKRSWKRQLLINLKQELLNRIDKLVAAKILLQLTTTIIMIVIWNLLKSQIQTSMLEVQVQWILLKSN